MSEIHPSEDKAVLYVTDGLTPAERRDFETELADSAELRVLVRELEEGSTLLAHSSPQRRPPAKVWQAIEKDIASEPKRQPVPAFWVAWWRYGWAAAAAFFLGWLLYAVWVNRAGTTISSRTAPFPQTLSQADPLLRANPPAKTAGNAPHSSNKPAILPQTAASDASEIARLRHQVTDLQNRVAGLSLSVAQQQALLGESNRIKFFQMTSGSGGGTATAATISPALQYALFVAMARELGWAPSADSSQSANAGNNALPSGLANPTNIDFLDLRTSTNGTPNTPPPQPQPNTQASSHATPETAPVANAGPIVIPAFTSGNNVIVAVDQSVAPAGTQLNFSNSDQSLGTTTLGENPMVITIPTSAGGGTVFITTGGQTGYTNIFQFFNAPLNP